MSLEDVVNPPPVPSPPHHPTPSTYPSEDQTADPLQVIIPFYFFFYSYGWLDNPY